MVRKCLDEEKWNFLGKTIAHKRQSTMVVAVTIDDNIFYRKERGSLDREKEKNEGETNLLYLWFYVISLEVLKMTVFNRDNVTNDPCII